MVKVNIVKDEYEMITSTQNKLIKQIRKLRTRRERHKTKTFFIEGFHLIEEAIKSNWSIKKLIVREDITPSKVLSHIPTIIVSTHVFDHISLTETPQGIAAIVQMNEIKNQDHTHVLLLDAIQDPGNLGTIIRTADAAGFSKIVLGDGTVDLYNDKVIRSTQGSLFNIEVVSANLKEVIQELQKDEFTVYASSLDNAKPYQLIKAKEKVALILGNEGAGISQTFVQLADESIYIPIYGKAESLNVGVAAGILMYALK